MSNVVWRGDASAIAQVNTLTVGGAPAAGQVYSVTINGKVISYTAIGGDTNATIATALAALLAATTAPPEFREITWADQGSGVITATAATAGIPFTNTSTATGTGTLATVIATANSGPNDLGLASNWSTGSLPGNGDAIYFQDSNADALYNTDALAAVAPVLIQIDASYTGSIGLPYTNTNGYIEYRPRYLQFAGWTLANIGQGQGNGSGKIQLDAQANDHTTNIWKTASSSSETGMPCVLIKGGSTATKINLQKGLLGVALFAGETAVLPALNLGYVSAVASDAQAWLGSGCTLTTVTKTGGKLYSQTAVPTLVQYAGTTTLITGNMTTCTQNRSSNNTSNVVSYCPPTGGTITTHTAQAGCALDVSGTEGTVTLTNATWYAGATINGPGGNLAMTNHASIPDGQASDVTLNLGPGRHVLVD